jgi:hypothetical protein
MNNELWKSVKMRVGTKEYKIRHSYSELVRIFDVEWLMDTKGRKLRIKNLGLLKISDIEFQSHINTLVFKCVRTGG